MYWVGEVYKKLVGSEYDNLCLRVWQKIGCFMMVDGLEDGFIKFEGLKSYIVLLLVFLEFLVSLF